MWAVEYQGNIINTYDTEDKAWEYVMRGEVNGVKGAHEMEVVEIVEADEDALIADLLGTS